MFIAGRLKTFRLLYLAGLIFLTFTVPDGNALTLTVNFTGDVGDIDPGDGVCSVTAGPVHSCSLRAAIQTLNHFSDAEADIIILPPGTYQLAINGKDEDSSSTGDLDVSTNMTIKSQGPEHASTTIVDGNQIDRVFHTRPPSSNDITVHMENFTIQGGKLTGPGGGIKIGGDTTFQKGTHLLLEGMIIRDNSTTSKITHPAVYGTGAGLYVSSFSSVEMRRTTLSGNNSDDRGGGIFGGGGSGGITIYDSAIINNSAKINSGITSYQQLSLDNVTVSGNNGNGVISFNDVPSGLEDISFIRHSTITNNTGSLSQYGTITLSDVVTVIMLNTVVADNSSANCRLIGGGKIVFDKNNLISDDSCDLDGSGNIINAAPLLEPLADNGGPTKTHIPQRGSPLIDAGFHAPSQLTYHDQRGILRPQGVLVDIGAVEVEPKFPWPIILPAIMKKEQ